MNTEYRGTCHVRPTKSGTASRSQRSTTTTLSLGGRGRIYRRRPLAPHKSTWWRCPSTATVACDRTIAASSARSATKVGSPNWLGLRNWECDTITRCSGVSRVSKSQGDIPCRLAFQQTERPQKAPTTLAEQQCNTATIVPCEARWHRLDRQKTRSRSREIRGALSPSTMATTTLAVPRQRRKR
jgi:hypothetical protein